MAKMTTFLGAALAVALLSGPVLAEDAPSRDTVVAEVNGKPITLADHQASKWIAEPLHLLGLEVTEDLGRVLLVEAQHQHRRHLHAAHLIQDQALAFGDVVAGDLAFILFRHLWLPIL